MLFHGLRTESSSFIRKIPTPPEARSWTTKSFRFLPTGNYVCLAYACEAWTIVLGYCHIKRSIGQKTDIETTEEVEEVIIDADTIGDRLFYMLLRRSTSKDHWFVYEILMAYMQLVMFFSMLESLLIQWRGQHNHSFHCPTWYHCEVMILSSITRAILLRNALC